MPTECAHDDCQKPSFCRGWCNMHYSRWQRHGDVNIQSKPRPPKPVCSVDGCEQESQGKGWCNGHYMRVWRTGDLDPGRPLSGAPLADVEERFWTKVDKGGPNGCWIWTAATGNAGYGVVRVNDINRPAYRVAYEFAVGPIPPGLELDHLCVNPPCVNPAHLEPVTHQENMRRGPTNVAGRNAAKTHCPQGHPYDEANTMFRSNGNRVCRTCNAVRSRAAWMKRTGRS